MRSPSKQEVVANFTMSRFSFRLSRQRYQLPSQFKDSYSPSICSVLKLSIYSCFPSQPSFFYFLLTFPSNSPLLLVISSVTPLHSSLSTFIFYATGALPQRRDTFKTKGESHTSSVTPNPIRSVSSLSRCTSGTPVQP